ncbi:MAG: hypothetical protein P4L43_16450 [Syntrophobacteraceae bacterium]|nr:hypothetical protein [Syntrophobacteraceae bacterium]
MPVNFIQPSYASGELAPALYARVDLDKFSQGAKLLRNFFVWPQGGVSNRSGTMFVGRCKDSSYPVHLIPFQFNLVQTYILEFGHHYLRIIMNGGYVLEPVIAISSITRANPGVIVTGAPHGFSNGDQVSISGTGTALDSTPGRQYLVINSMDTTFSIADLDGSAINTAGYATYSGSGGTVARVYTLATPYAGADVADIKWTQSNDVITLCHTNYPPQDLTRTNHYAWTIAEVSFAAKIAPPTGLSVSHNAGTNSPSGQAFYYSYVVTALSLSPPEQSVASQPASVQANLLDSNTGSENVISWQAETAANLYYVYKANPQTQPAPAGAMYGYIGQTTSTSFTDTQIAPDFSQAPPTHTDPFTVGPIATVSVTNGGSGYNSTVSLYASDVTGSGAVLVPTVTNGVITAVTIESRGQNYQAPVIGVANSGIGAKGHINVATIVTTLNGFTSQMVTATVEAMGQNYFGDVTVAVATSGGDGVTFTPVITNGAITSINVSGLGQGYTDGDSLVFAQSGGSGASFTASINPSGNYPSCACYFQQRKCFAGSLNSPQTVWMTQPADYNNMDVTNPSQNSDAITLTIAAQQVNAIKHLVPMNDLLIFTSGGVWRILTGYITQPEPVTPTNTVVIPQTWIGAADLPPIVVNYDILYVQAKGSIVRDLAYNFWMNVYTGTDMSVLAEHLFFGHNMVRWAYAEQPWYQIWTVRDDGVLLSFTYLKEQNVYAWAHHDSPGCFGTDRFLSVASIPEQQVEGVNVDSVYFVVQRTIPGINGAQPVKYIERMDSRNMGTLGASDVTKAWFLDAALQYCGTATAEVCGLDHLNGATVSILADGNVMPQQVVSNGAITLPTSASRITVGLPYVAQMQSLPMMPQGMAMQAIDYRKTLKAIALKVQDTRGIKVGPNFSNLTEIKEWNSTVNMGGSVPLTTGTQRLIVYQQFTVDDNICLQCDQPLPCTILGISPEMSIGDSPG